MAAVPLAEQLRARGLGAGLDAVGFARAERFAGTERDLVERKAAGLHGGMQFTYRRPERSADPTRALPGAHTLVVGARSYRRPDPARPGGGPQAAVARYARLDHYADLRAGLAAVGEVLRAAGHRARVLADDNALVDREAARRAGLGWYGKNANLLLPGRGSWFVLGAVLTDAVLPPSEVVADGCGSCRRCLDGCPTGAIVAPGVVDARRCLAWLAQAPGTFPAQHRAALGDRLYGCDDCQEVCPPNRRAGEVGGDPGTAWVDVHGLLDATDDELIARHGRWYIAERDPRHLRRNALIVLGNVGDGADRRVEATLRRYLGHHDALLRAHAAWAARRLGRDDLLVTLAGETAAEVRAELAGPVAARRAEPVA